jgi:hypothetical protein
LAGASIPEFGFDGVLALAMIVRSLTPVSGSCLEGTILLGRHMRFLSLRAFFLLAFVVGMPVLALPPVARWVDELLYGPPPVDFARPSTPAPAAAAPHAELIVPAGYLDNSPAPTAGPRGLDAQTVAAPPLAPPPVFQPIVPATAPGGPPEPVIGEATIVRLQQIRQRLEELGAEYVVVDAIDNGGGYRCLCRMLVDPRSRFTRPFEATGADPLQISEQVLREVESWRMAGVENRARPQ